jgi:hypothetical protein
MSDCDPYLSVKNLPIDIQPNEKVRLQAISHAEG